ncbi:MAG: hypothetical protein KatS3mg051_0918 [Anaerolineae bacterium]|nr:MAG: hypothetical protein KatS3mg051_0918 [Anaerolineae bacterium]
MPHYPETTVIKGLARVIRHRQLPRGAVHRRTLVSAGAQVSAVTVVLQGEVLREYHVLDVAKALKWPKATPAQIAEAILVTEGQRVRLGQELAQRGRGRRPRVLQSPAEGEIVEIEDGRIILQSSERSVEVLARIPGEVESVENEVVRINGTGAVIQCAWGNGQFFFGSYLFLPSEGFAELRKADPTMSPYRGKVLISPVPVERAELLIAQHLQVAGVVAPGMPASLREFAMGLTFPVILTEGFGHRQPTTLIYRLLHSNMGRQATFDAALPERWSWDRPEIVIPLPAGGVFVEPPSVIRTLEVGEQVRLTRAPWDGVLAEVVALPAGAQTIDNGLRVQCARVRLPNRREVLVPLANLEALG